MISDKQLRQRLEWAIARVENLVDEGKATEKHLLILRDELTERINAEDRVPSGLWISPERLAQLSTTSGNWFELKDAAYVSWPNPINLHDKDSKSNIYCMAGALFAARVNNSNIRNKVVNYLEKLITEGHDTSTTALSWGRNLGAFVIAADLIGLHELHPLLNDQFRLFLIKTLNHENSGDGMDSVLDGTLRPNNIGNWCRFSALATAIYLKDDVLIQNLVDNFTRYLGDTSIHVQFRWHNDQSWQINENDSSSWVGIIGRHQTKNGISLDGALPEDMRRSASFDPILYPPEYTNRYIEEALDPVLATLVLLQQHGYTDATSWSDSAVLRACRYLYWLSSNYGNKGWVFFESTHEASRALVRKLFPETQFPIERTRSQLDHATKGFSWTYWTHQGD